LFNYLDFVILVATTHIVNKPDLKTMSKNKKKKLKKKEKQKQKMLELTQQQIQVNFSFFCSNIFKSCYHFKDAEKQKQNLLNSPNQINLNKISLTDEVQLSPTNGHKQNSLEESDEENPDNEQLLTEQAALPAATATVISDDTNKQTDSNEPDPINRRM